MDIKEIAVENIKAYAKNAKKHDETQIKQIANSIKEFGFRQPVVIVAHFRLIGIIAEETFQRLCR